jgi:hypothetical protein
MPQSGATFAGRFPRVTISSIVSRASGAVLLAGGLTLLFASDTVLPVLSPGFPTAATWIGQLLAAAWLGVAALNWLHRGAVLGGIYGRPIVVANAVLYFVSATSALRAAVVVGRPLWAVVVVAGAFAAMYAALLFRGPFDDLA